MHKKELFMGVLFVSIIFLSGCNEKSGVELDTNEEIEIIVDYDYWLIEHGEIRVESMYYCDVTTSVRGEKTYYIEKQELPFNKECFNISLNYPDLKDNNNIDYQALAKNVYSSVTFHVGGGEYNNRWYISVGDKL